MKAVKFIKVWQPYEPGQVVDLDDKLADKLIEDGVCKEYRSGLRSIAVKTGSNS
jgi:hypothetical protein